VSPESSLARLKGCDGYIAQVWTGTARNPVLYRGQLRERTFESAFLEYGAMMNLVRGTGRRVWFLNDPVEDNPNHDWTDYRVNWESTMVASLFQPEVWQFEVAPWPERVFGGRYPRSAKREDRKPMPPAYATEVQTVINALNDMDQKRVTWDCGTTGIGVIISDSLMFERGDPEPSDPSLSHLYGLALPLLKRGMPVTPVQLENVTLPDYLKAFRVLLLTYRGMKPLSPEVHPALAAWVKQGGVLVLCDDDGDPYNAVREWWNSDGRHCATPREDLFALLGLPFERAAAKAENQPPADSALMKVGKGGVIWMQENPARLAASAVGDARLVATVKQAAAHARLKWRETNYLLLRRGPYVLGAGLDESVAGEPKQLTGRFVNLFDSELRVQKAVTLAPGTRCFLVDLDAVRGRQPNVLASACKALPTNASAHSFSLTVEGVVDTPAVVLMRASKLPRSVMLAGQPLGSFHYSPADQLLWISFSNESRPRELAIEF
jgi:hypothetical protein